jgi:hypothetical protein
MSTGFEDLDYPGRRPPKNRGAAPPPPPPAEWDAKPLSYRIQGEKQEFYTIGHVAKALGCSVQSVRAWEDKGLLPRSPYRSPRTVRPVAGGKSDKGKRLWTREQIEGILRLADQHKVILNKKPPTVAFARDVGTFFASLVKQ